MNRHDSVDEVPSIIQEIVFYDKPNVKSVVPEAIVPAATKVPLGKGDLVFSRIRQCSSSETSFIEDQHEAPDKNDLSTVGNNSLETSNELETTNKNRVSNLEKTLELDELAEDDTQDTSGKGVNLEKQPEDTDILKAGKKIRKSNQGSKPEPLKTGLKKKSQASKSVKKIKETTHKSTENQDIKKFKEDSDTNRKSLNVSKTTKKEYPFKTPKGPAKKAEKTAQKTTMLNYFTVKSKKDDQGESPDKKLISTKPSSSKTTVKDSPTKESKENESRSEKEGAKSNKAVETREKTPEIEKESPEKSTGQKRTKDSPIMDTPPKRGRGRPRKSDVGEKKNYTELTNVPLDSTETPGDTGVSTDDLEELLDDAREQVRALGRVEEELQNIFKPKEQTKKQVEKGTRKSGRTPKEPQMLIKSVKNEAVDSVEESSNDPADMSLIEVYGSDEDSRGEWVPEEYAEYKQQHTMKQQKQGKMFPCKFCGNQFTSYYSMRKHRALEHDDTGKDRKEGTYKEPVKCKQEQGDSDEESRDEWMPQDYADYKMKHKMNKMKRVQWYKCKICCAVFSNYYKLSKHRVEHENKPNPYQCKHCDARFKDVETLMAHIRVHQGKDPYQCKKCEQGFMTKAELDEHTPVHILKKGPTPPKRFRCDICNKEFSKLCDIERHTRVHTGEKPCECNICHKRFQQSHNLSKHLLTHLHVKPFQCEICNKKFGRIDVLNRHLLIHSLEKPFKCELCGKGFIRQIQLTNHIAKVHTSSDSGLVVAEEQDNGLMEDEPHEAVMDVLSEEIVENGQFEEVMEIEEVIAL